MNELILNGLRRDFTVRARDMGSYAVLKKSGMTFRISAYDVKGLGDRKSVV